MALIFSLGSAALAPRAVLAIAAVFALVAALIAGSGDRRTEVVASAALEGDI
jgi:hypothetical protein